MAVRAAMASIILELRRKIQDTASATWTDQQLQDILDRWREYVGFSTRVKLFSDDEAKVFVGPYRNIESAKLYDAANNGNLVSASNYTADLIACSFTFTTEQSSYLYLYAVTYNIWDAAADALEELLADSSRVRQWSRGAVSQTGYDLESLIKSYRSQGGVNTVGAVRVY